jgi:hypothetical protein
LGLLFTVGLAGVAATQEKGQPFQALWATLTDLGARVAALEHAGSAGASRVVDAKGQVVGQFVPTDGVLRQIDGQWFSIRPVFSDRIGGGDPPQFGYENANCTGNAYIVISPSPTYPTALLARSVTASNGLGYYAGDPIGPVVIRSFSTISPPDGCLPAWMPTYIAGPVATLDLAGLGLTPPFRVQ